MSSTLKQVAEFTGLSYQTVSKVLNNGGKDRHLYRIETQEKVLRAAAALDYRPNSFAQGMRSGKFGMVSLLLSTNAYRSHLPSAMLDGIHDALERRGLRLMVAKLPDDKLIDGAVVPRVLRELGSDGLLINYTHQIPAQMLSTIDEFSTPAVWMNARLSHNCVRPDDMRGATEATRHLLSLGHRKIAYLQCVNWTGHYSTVDRSAGYERAMREAGLQPIVLGNLDGRELAPAEIIAQRAELSQRLRGPLKEHQISAVVTYGSIELLAARRAAEANGGPGTAPLAAVGFDDDLILDSGLPVTTMHIPNRKVGQLAVDMLAVQFEKPHAEVAEIAVPFEILAYP